MVKKRLLVLGRSHMELTLTMPKLPEAGMSLRSDGKYGFTGGGRGVLTAIAASKLGADAILCSRVGSDVYGNRLRMLLENNGVSLRSIPADRTRPTSLKVNLLEDSGANRSVSYDGAAPYISKDDIEEAFVAYPDALLLCGDLPLSVMKSAVGFAAGDRLPAFLDVPLRSPELPLHDLGRFAAAVLGEEEIYSYTGMHPDSAAEYIRAAIKLSSQIDAAYFVFRLGSRGSYVTDGKYSEIIAPTPAEIADLTAASECFIAALASRYAIDRDMKQAATFAQAASTLCAAKAGAAGSLPSLESVEEYMDRIG